MPLQATSGAASYDAFGGGVAAVPNYIEDVFNTNVWQGDSSLRLINNGIDLSGKGGLVWLKSRSVGFGHYLQDTARGADFSLASDTTDASFSSGQMTAFNSNGFTLSGFNATNGNSNTYVGWTFREQPKFFDVVTWTGDGVATRAISHSLDTASIGTIIIKRTSSTADWFVWHRSLSASSKYLQLNTTSAELTQTSGLDPISDITSTQFTVRNALNGLGAGQLNRTDETYVAYLFAHNAGGFGLTGTDNVISCGSYLGNGSATGPSINLGYEPQWVLIKRSAGGSSDWILFDSMRGLTMTDDAYLVPNTPQAEIVVSLINPAATGFTVNTTISALNASGSTYIYIAIRRGPMKVPTTGTSVFAPVARTGTGSNATVNVGFPPDLVFESLRSPPTYGPYECDRLRGSNLYLTTTSTVPEANGGGLISFDAPNGNFVGNNAVWETSGGLLSNWAFRRAPGFFDVVCYTGTDANLTVATNLGVQPELVFLKRRNTTSDWGVGIKVGSSTNYYSTLRLNSTAALGSFVLGFTSTGNLDVPSSFSVSGGTYVAYLFATCPGVSKVFSFTGNGTTQTINCGFTGGARFVLLKASSATGGWFVYDTARGMTVMTDPYLQLNSTAAEVATLGSVTTVATGFAVNEAVLAGVNTNGVSYIGLAIA